ncbi:MAG: NAD-dependent epimerase/dehydratase family protein [Nitrospinota bacterium]|nr:MAG: NAD-dependent epimerase/dehydratase family protein [Nitrospinota bacterium]
MKDLVTGATGFIGANVVRALLRRGREVRVLVRRNSDTRNIDGLDVERVYGDLRHLDSLFPAVQGCDTVYHVAAHYSLWSRERNLILQSNVEGTRNILTAAGQAGVRRVVYTSSVATIGIPPDGSWGNEETPLHPGDLVGDYKRSKYLAELEARKFIEQGVPVVIVNPSAPVGPWDIKPTPTGQVIVNFLQGKTPAYLDTGLNLIAVEDVAEGHILAAERGRIGERYILGNANLTLVEIFRLLEEVSGVKAPRWRIPYPLALAAGYCSEWIANYITHSPPAIPLAGVKMARKRMFFDARKAITELGLPQTPIKEALRRAVHWFREHGYA